MMRLYYSIRFDDFKTLQAPLPAAKGATAGFKGVLVVCALIAFLGVFLMLQGMGLPVGMFLIGLGVAAATKEISVRMKPDLPPAASAERSRARGQS